MNWSLQIISRNLRINFGATGYEKKVRVLASSHFISALHAVGYFDRQLSFVLILFVDESIFLASISSFVYHILLWCSCPLVFRCKHFELPCIISPFIFFVFQSIPATKTAMVGANRCVRRVVGQQNVRVKKDINPQMLIPTTVRKVSGYYLFFSKNPFFTSNPANCNPHFTFFFAIFLCKLPKNPRFPLYFDPPYSNWEWESN